MLTDIISTRPRKERGMRMAISSISSNQLTRDYQSLATGRRIQSAADDAAGLAISQKLQSQSNSYDVGSRNAATSQDMLKVADGALDSITNSLQRIRELSIQASNGLYTDADRGAIQSEIGQLKQSISDTASQTQFNTKNLLDGTMGTSRVASGPQGNEMDIRMPDATLQALGIADYDVSSGNFDLSAIDSALEKVSASRSSIGASSNRLDSIMAYNANASYNLTASESRIADLDYPKAVSDKKRDELLQTFQMMMQRKQIENENGRVMQLFRS